MRRNKFVEQETRMEQNIFQKHQTIINKEIFLDRSARNESEKKLSKQLSVRKRMAKPPIDTET